MCTDVSLLLNVLITQFCVIRTSSFFVEFCLVHSVLSLLLSSIKLKDWHSDLYLAPKSDERNEC